MTDELNQETETETETPSSKAPSPADETVSSETNYAEMFGGLAEEELNDDTDDVVEETKAEDQSEEEPAKEQTTDETKAEEEPTKSESESESEAEESPKKEEAEEETKSEEEPEGKTRAELEEDIKSAEEQIQEFRETVTKNRSQAIELLAERHYDKGIPDELWDEIDENPRKGISKLMATVYMDAVQGITGTLMAKMPEMIKAVNSQHDRSSEFEQQFYSEYDMLKDPKYKESIERYAQTYIQVNPNSTIEDRIKNIGTAVCLMHKLTPPGLDTKSQETPKHEPPAKPAGTSNVTKLDTPKPSDNQFVQYSEELLEDI